MHNAGSALTYSGLAFRMLLRNSRFRIFTLVCTGTVSTGGCDERAAVSPTAWGLVTDVACVLEQKKSNSRVYIAEHYCCHKNKKVDQ